jgi:16S rRNA (cytidine1402-2'-O)-methyltransferase
LLEILRGVDLVAAEDTRHTGLLLTHYGIEKSLLSLHQHNEESRGDAVIGILESGKDVALVSDAGMPGISDPGASLVNKAVAAGVPVTVIPGPTAFVMAVVLSGFSTARIMFEGFIPRSGKERRLRLQSISTQEATTVLYEAPHRLQQTLFDLSALTPGRQAAAVRELTKKFEEVRRGTLEELHTYFDQNEPRGEFCLVLAGTEPQRADAKPKELEAAARALIEAGKRPSEVAQELAGTYGLKRSDAYEIVKRVKHKGAETVNANVTN